MRERNKERDEVVEREGEFEDPKRSQKHSESKKIQAKILANIITCQGMSAQRKKKMQAIRFLANK